MAERCGSSWFVLALGAALAAAPVRVQGQVTQAAVDATLQQLRSSALQVDAAVRADGIRLRAALATLTAEQGVFFPTTAVHGRVEEFVFLGKATLSLPAPDRVEAQQLELFTGAPDLHEEFHEAVFAVALDAASEAILARPLAAPIPDHDAARAADLLARWRTSPERRSLAVEEAILADVLGDRAANAFFAGWVRGETLGDLLLVVEPRAREQVEIGRFESLDLSERNEKRLRRLIHRERQRGRLLSADLDNMGQWDTWLSSPLVVAGKPAPGSSGFEARHYELDVTIDSSLELAGHARIRTLATVGVGSVVLLRLPRGLGVEQVLDVEGRPLAFHRADDRVFVFLGDAPAVGQELTLEVRYRGPALEEFEGVRRKRRPILLRHTLDWYPHVGGLDLATYDVTLEVPKEWEIFAAGAALESSVGESTRRARYEVDQPVKAFSFQIGRFTIYERQVGETAVRLGVDPLSGWLLSGEVLLDWVAGAIRFLQQQFGPLPVRQLQVVTSPREFSQTVLGFVSLSTEMMMDDSLFVALGFQDPQTVIAHELAHLWWGHMVSWSSYRDRWLSEALANFSADLYSRHRRGIPGMSYWEELELSSLARSGHRIVDLGPVVLGDRLVSSLSPAAYRAIVYQKGSLVLQMLSLLVGQENFVELLRSVATQTSFGVLSTERLFDLVSQATNLDLDPFTELFVYGTALPVARYSYHAEEIVADQWRLKGTVELGTEPLQRFRVVRRQDGSFDVVMEFAPTPPVPEGLRLAVPSRLWIDDEKKGPGGRSVEAQVILDGPTTELRLVVTGRPILLDLDPHRQTLVTFVDECDDSFDGLLKRAHSQYAAGDAEAAAQLLGRIREPGDTAEEPLMLARQITASLSLARIAMDRDEDPRAEAELTAARKNLRRLDGLLRQLFSPEIEVAEARLALRQGEYKRTVRLLSPVLDREESWDDAEHLLLLAAAAHELGDADLKRRALERASVRRAQAKGLEVIRSASATVPP